MNIHLSSVILGLCITSITFLIGCGEGADGSVVDEGVSNNNVSNDGISSNGVSDNNIGNNGVTDSDVSDNNVSDNNVGNKGAGNNGGGDNGVRTRPRAFLTWDPVKHHRPVTYTVHFGKQSSGQAGSCNYERSGNVSKPQATVTDLDSNTLYFFAVSTYDGDLRSQCSDEVSKLTP